MDKKVVVSIVLMLAVLGLVVMQASQQPNQQENQKISQQTYQQTTDSNINNGTVERWYTQQQVAQGADIFKTNCAACHGPEAASIPNWREPDESGNYPPPPLDGSAHAWHHPLALLQKTVREGGAAVGGQMPPFKDLLSIKEIDAVLAWVQTHWNDKVYQMWSERNG